MAALRSVVLSSSAFLLARARAHSGMRADLCIIIGHHGATPGPDFCFTVFRVHT